MMKRVGAVSIAVSRPVSQAESQNKNKLQSNQLPCHISLTERSIWIIYMDV